MLQQDRNKELQRSKSWRGRRAAIRFFSKGHLRKDIDQEEGCPPQRPRE
jgi:hypothetical protein